MDYSEAVEVLFGLRRYPPRPGTAATADLLAALEDPHEAVRYVQVAGSNGKGTTARMTERVLREAGASVGLFTSPHLEDVRERVRVDGRPVAKRAVVAFVEAVEDRLRGQAAEPPTFFEATTALALWEFARREVDVAVLEVGLGGRHDATSVVDPVASAVTSVSLEHTDVLGDTVAAIAHDKAHVAPDDGPLVTATTGEALAAVREVADDVVTVARTTADTDADTDADPDVWVTYGGPVDHMEATVTVESATRGSADGNLLGTDWRVETRLPTPGAHQAENAGVATALARAVFADDRVDLALDPDFDLDVAPGTVPTLVAERGLRRARWPGRFETLSTSPLVVLDGAHNPGAAERLADTLAAYEHDDIHLVLGALVDKDHGEVVRTLPDAATVHTCSPPVDRAEDAVALAGVVERQANADAVEAVDAVDAAFDRALSAADPEDCVLVTGSQYVVREVRRRYATLDRRPRVASPADATRVTRDADVPAAERPGAAARTLSRTLRLRLGPDATERLRAATPPGVTCHVADHDDEESRAVLLSGPVAALRALAADLAEADPTTAERVRRVLGDPADDDPRGPPSLPGSVDGDDAAVFRSPVDVTSDGRVVSDDRLPWLTGETPTIMGIVNVTPDSFHDGGEYDEVEAAVDHARDLVDAGVGVLDVGGESTRPGADPVAVQREIDRVRPVIEGIREAGVEVPISVDTRKAPVARAALAAGADIVNDVSGLEDPDLPRVAAEYDAGLVVMHSLDAPVDPDRGAEYDDVVHEVATWLRERVLFAERVGVDRERIVVDPGLGFGKSSAEDFRLLDHLGEFRALGCPVLVGHSHKSMFGLAGYGPDERRHPTAAATALAVDRGADLVRVHDAAENVAALRTAVTTAATREGADRDS